MIAISITILAMVLLIAVVVKPVLGMLLLWPVLLCFPHAITENMLPLNIGFDDLYVAILFVIVLIRRQMEDQRIRFGRWGMLVLSFWIISLVSNIVGMILLPQSTGPLLVIKESIKQLTSPFIALMVLNAINSPAQMRQLIRWFLIGSIGLSVVAIIQWFMPYEVAAFYHSQELAPGEAVMRATGTTRGPWELGAILAIAMTISISLLTIGRGVVRRLVPLVCAGVAFFALVLTTSRASWLFLLAGVLAVLAIGKRPIRGLIVTALVASMLVLFPALLETIQDRVESTGSLRSLDTSSQTRFDIWGRILSQIDPGSVVLGVGASGSFAKHHHSPHNYYIAIVTQYGLAGIVFFLVLGTSLVRRMLANIRWEHSPENMAIWKGILAVTLGLLVYSLTADSLNTDLVAKTMFFSWSFLYLRDYVALGEESPARQPWDAGYAWQDRPSFHAPIY